MEKGKNIHEVYDALCEFVIEATKKDAPVYAVEALPGTLESLIEIHKLTLVQKRS